MAKTQKVYALVLYVDIQSTPGSIIYEIGGISTDKKVLENLKTEKDKELQKYLDDDSDDSDICYCGYDLSSRPTWDIVKYDLLTKK